MSVEELDAFLQSLPPEEKPTDAQSLAQTLFRHKRLTKFQAQAVYQGKTKGLVMGNYVILDRLGKGGMGEVYKAQHRRMDRLVALKLLPPAATQKPSAIKRFQREVKAAARLVHPNIVTAYDADEDRGVHFLVMEYVEGQDLASVVQQQGPLPIDKAVDYTLQAARGLQYAHQADVIHRDIKPSNLLLDTRGTVKILDMGLARLEDAPAAETESPDAGITQSGEVLGTVDYMSPEQALNTRDTDARTDIYSLGATLYFLLTGRPMYTGSSLVERLLAHRDQPIPSLRQARPEVPEALDRLFQRMVAKRREDRPQRMEEVVAELERCMALGLAGTSAPSPASPAPGTRSPIAQTLTLSETTRRAPSGLGTSGPNTMATAEPSSRPRMVESQALGSGASGAPPKPAASFPSTSAPSRPTRKTTVKRPLESLWVKAVEEAEQARRRKRYSIRALLGWVMTLAAFAAVAAGVYFAAAMYWRNSQRLRQSEKLIVEAVRQVLQGKPIDPIENLQFAEGSPWLGVPERLRFEIPVSCTTRPGGKRPFGTIKGTFERTTGTLHLDVSLSDGTEQRGLVGRLSPVP